VLELVLRITFSLLVVLALMWGVARLARRPLSRRGTGTLTVLARQQLSRGASVAVLRVVDRALVLGVTDQQVTLLGEADLDEVERQQAPPVRAARPAAGAAGLNGRLGSRPDGAAAPRRGWSRAVEYLRERTERRS
jgi:flagellar protein FliO/FliZ